MTFHQLVEQVDTLLGKKEDQKLRNLLIRQNFHDLAHLIDRLNHGKRKTFAMLPPELQAEVVIRMSERSKAIVLPRLSDQMAARFLHFNDEDDAADILQYLTAERRSSVLSHLKQDKKGKIEKLLTFDPESAGGLMDLNFIIVKPDFLLKDVVEKVHKHLETQKQIPLVVVTDTDNRILGYIPYKSILLAPQNATVANILHRLPIISHTSDQENVLKMAIREKSDVLGVTDDQNRFLGIVHLRDILRIAQTEATEDIYKFAGVNREEEILDPPLTAIRMRYRWLIINLGTAFLASFVVSLFENTIDRMAILAAYMPIVAGMGGNAGTQTLAVVVRGLALGEASWHHAWRIIGKEFLTGLTNGLINGSIVAIVVYLLRGTPMIGLVLGISMVINMVVAGVFGSIIPIVLRALRIDPAIASSVFVTTATDIFGFLSFLGLATLVL